MPRRSILTKRQQARLLDLPTDTASLHEHYTLDDFDLEQVRYRRRAHNKMAFALQLCALRYPGRLLIPGEVIPVEVLQFLADQIGIDADALAGYATREETRRDSVSASVILSRRVKSTMLVVSMVVYLLWLGCCLSTTIQPDTPPTF